MNKLLQPISDSNPCGEYLKDNRTVYRGLRNSFNLAQSSFRQMLETPEAAADEVLGEQNATNWQQLASQCEDTLTSTSKDIEVFCWYITAQMYTRAPLSNLAMSLGVFSEAISTYWSELNPTPPEKKLKATDEAGQLKEIAEMRSRPLLQLVGESDASGLLHMPLQLVPLLADIDYARYTLAERNGQLAELKAEAAKEVLADRSGVTATILSLGETLDHLVAIDALVSAECKKVGAQGVSFGFVKRKVDALLNALRYLVGDQLKPWPLDKATPAPPAPAETDADDAAPEEVVQTASAGETVDNRMIKVMSGGDIVNRDHAFNELRRVADYFYRTEPHSPIYMLLERAIRWGYLSLPQLLGELVGDNESVMARITTLAGLESTEKTDIPEAQVSHQDLQRMHSSSTASSAGVTAPTSVATESISIPVDSEPTGESGDQGDSGDSDEKVSSFEW